MEVRRQLHKDQSWVLSCFLCTFLQLGTSILLKHNCLTAMQMTLKCTVYFNPIESLLVYRVHLEVLNGAWMSWGNGW